MSLLTKALAIPSNQTRKNEITAEEIELAIAWLEDRVSLKQVTKALGGKYAPLAWLSLRLREAYRKGHLKVK